MDQSSGREVDVDIGFLFIKLINDSIFSSIIDGFLFPNLNHGFNKSVILKLMFCDRVSAESGSCSLDHEQVFISLVS